MLHSDITDGILKAFYKVYNSLGYGFLEKVYENALLIELANSGFQVIQQHPIQVLYEKQPVGEYFADLIVNDLVVLELKAAEHIREEHVAQITNYLKATRKEVGLLLNFGFNPNSEESSLPTLFKDPCKSAQSASSAFH